VRELIKRGEVMALKETMEKSINAGMQTFDQALVNLFRSGKITEEEAIRNADSQNNVALQIKLGKGKNDAAASSLSLVSEEKPEVEPDLTKSLSMAKA
jgi:twitching motility protein PilU